MISICTPIYNRKTIFEKFTIEIYKNINYPKEKMEWLIYDDSNEKEKLDISIFDDLKNIKYFYNSEKKNISEKRNFLNEKCKGDYIMYMDDDDFYEPNRINYCLDLLKNSNKLIIGCSKLHIYYTHIKKTYETRFIYKDHATANTFFFKKELLKITNFNNKDQYAEEKYFLNGYIIPMIQADPSKILVVIDHNNNTIDKKNLEKKLIKNTIPSKFIKIIHNFF